MAAKCNIDESKVIKRYEECETARVVAQEFSVSAETIYRILKRNGVQRTHRHQKEPKSKFASNCRSKFCPALVVMLRVVLDANTSDIARLIGCHLSTVSSVISRRGLQRKKPVSKKDVDLKAIEREYISGASSYDLGRKYGVNPSTVSAWMRERGHHRGKGGGAVKRMNQARHDEAVRKFFAKFGSDITSNSIRHAERRRIRMENAPRDYGITWKALAKRNNSMKCEICGIECDPNDKRWGSSGPTHPSVDHVIEICKGGTDTWDNVRLACCACNIGRNKVIANA